MHLFSLNADITRYIGLSISGFVTTVGRRTVRFLTNYYRNVSKDKQEKERID